MYNIEKVDQDIAKALPANAPLATEWRGDLLGGVMVIKSVFADGTPLVAVPNYARTNRDPAPPPEPPRPATPPVPGAPPPPRPAPRPPTSIVWIAEA